MTRLVVFLLFSSPALASLIYLLRQYILAVSSTNWPTATADISESHIENQHGDFGITYRARVKYDFFVSGQKFSSKKIAFLRLPFSNSKERVEELIPEGINLVHYHPSKPRISVLIPGFKPDFVYLLWFVISILSILLVALALG